MQTDARSKRAEAALQETNAKLARAQRIAHIGSWENYLPTNELSWSEEMYHILGFPSNTPMNLAEVVRVFPPEELARFQGAMTAAVAGETPYSMDYRIVRPDGSERYIHDEGEVIRDEHGNALWMYGATHDITERKRAEAALNESERRLRSVLQSSPDTVYALDLASGRATFLNRPGFCGYLKEELEAPGSILHAVHPDDSATVRENWRQISGLDGPGKVIEYRLQCKDGAWEWIEQRTTILSREPDGAARQLLLTLSVITERKRMEEALRDSEERFRRAFHDTAVGTALVDVRGCFRQVNPALCRMLGYTEDELLGKSFQDITHPDDRPADAEFFNRVLAGEADSHCFEKRYACKDGSLIWALVSSSLIRDSQGRPRHFVSHMQDITGRKRAEEALRQRVEELAALYATSLDLVTPHPLPDLLRAIVERAARLLNASGGGLYLCEPERQQVRCMVSYNTPRDFTGVVLKYGEGAAGTVAQTGQPLIIDDYRAWPGRAAVFDEDQPFTAILSAPLIWQGQVTGVIHVLHDTQTRRFTQADQELLTLFAQQAAIAVANTRLLEDERAARREKNRLLEALEQRAEELTLLNRIGLAITSGLELTSVLRALDEQCRQVLPVDCFYVALYDAQSGLIRFPLFRDVDRDVAMPPQDMRARPGMTGVVIQRRQTLYVADTFDPHAVNGLQVIRAGGRSARSYVGVPLVLRDEVIGVMSMQNYQPNAYTPEQIRLLETIAAQAAIAVENARLYDEARRYAAELEERVAGRTTELQTALQRLETTDQLRRQFIIQVSHELRTPLTNIKTSVFLLERGKPEKHSQYIATLKRESEALRILIEDQLNLLALDVGKAQLNFQPVDVGKLATRLVADRGDLVADRGLTLRAESAPDLPPVLADPRMLPQAIAHLLAHAADRAVRGAEIVLRVAAHRDEQQAWVTIAVAEAAQHTADAAGSGLRRVVAEEIVKRHRGKLTFESAIGQGSAFTIWLPVAPTMMDDEQL
ncbi:MAG: PAS domain S-box protein [Chloroflexi bacterium]|nr:PAS domain S-box protein [Chloroflexota bacterium]